MKSKVFFIFFVIFISISGFAEIKRGLIFGDIDNFQMYLNSLDSTKLESIDFAKNKMFELFKDSKQSEKDEAFDLLWEFVTNLCSNIDIETALENEPNGGRDLVGIINYPSQKSKQFIAELGTNYSDNAFNWLEYLNRRGLQLNMSEGWLYISRGSLNYFKENFGTFLSESAFLFYQQLNIMDSNPLAEDAGIRISISELGELVIWWELFGKREDLRVSIKERAGNTYNNLTSWLLTGLDNTPAFDYNKGMLYKEYKTAYNDIIKKYPESSTALLLSDYLKILKKNKMKNTPEVQNFIEKRTNKLIY